MEMQLAAKFIGAGLSTMGLAGMDPIQRRL